VSEAPRRTASLLFMNSQNYRLLAALCAFTACASAQAPTDASLMGHRRMQQAQRLRRIQSRRIQLMTRPNKNRAPRVRQASAFAPRQAFDTSGDGALNGAYFVRQVMTLLDPDTSAILQAVSLTGTMTFDGTGNYSFSGQELNSAVSNTAVAYSTTGTYAVSSSSLVQIQTPIDIDNQDIEYGGAGVVGEVVASATEGQFNDIFIAIPEGPASSVQGSYQAGFIDYLEANASNVRDGYFTITSNGAGSFGNVTVNGAMANLGGAAVSQTLSGVAYSFSGSIGTITFPAASNPLTALVGGVKSFAVSPDGNILAGGGPNGFDLFVAVRGPSAVANTAFAGVYFQGALENDLSQNCGAANCMDSFYGSVASNGQGAGTKHERDVGFDYTAWDVTTDMAYNFPSSGAYSDDVFEWMLSVDGEALVQVGVNGYYTLVALFQAPQYSGTGVFVNPDGIVNSASFAPITNSIAPGEYVTLFGSGLGSTAQASSLPLPTTLGGASASVNGTAGPMLATYSGQLNVFVPNETPTYSFATFQTTGNGSLSNPSLSNPSLSNQVTLYTASTAPGVFSSTANGIGPADVFHADFTYVTQSSPAAVGETVLFYATGLGQTAPAVPDGAAAPGSQLAVVTDPNLEVDIYDSSGNDTVAAIVAAVLAPGLAGIYQINFTVPSGVASGEGYLDVGTTDGWTSEAKIYIQ
jgi:uncharacterized protein (TIGR03437 family)